MIRLVLFVSVVALAAAYENVWLRELDTGEDRRGFESSSLEFELERSGVVTKLNLQENRRVNANAPVFVAREDSHGNQRLEKQKGTPKLTTRFYHDKRNNGSFQVRMDERNKRRILFGSLRLDNEWFELSSVPLLLHAPKTARDMPYLLKQSTFNGLKGRGNNYLSDAAKTKKTSPSGIIEQIKRILDLERQIERDTESNPVYAVEVLAVIDPYLWKKFYDKTSASGGLPRDQATELKLREHLTHLISGVSLRYETIDNTELNIYVTVSGFLFYKTVDKTNPLKPESEITTKGGKKLVDAIVYLDNIKEWLKKLSGLPNNDHVLVVTELDITTKSIGDSVAGLAYVSGVCRDDRVSINEDGDYFATTSLMAHELGHNLGSGHDGEKEDEIMVKCPDSDKYLMAPVVADIRKNEKYTANPWKFSSCSITAFKKYITSLGSENCLLDKGDYFDEAEYNSHLKMLPGQLHTATQQCQLEWGPGSKLCEEATPPTDSDFCRLMACYEPSDDSCVYYTPARGTECGAAGSDMYCIDGKCVKKSEKYNQQSKVGVTGQTPKPGQCVDSGYQGFDCPGIADYFLSNNNAEPDQWCQDPTWKERCCDYCSKNAKRSVCVDTGKNGNTCEETATLFRESQFKLEPSYWCTKGDWKDVCCATCKDYVSNDEAKRNFKIEA